jgi:hypothetical protein
MNGGQKLSKIGLRLMAKGSEGTNSKDGKTKLKEQVKVDGEKKQTTGINGTI